MSVDLEEKLREIAVPPSLGRWEVYCDAEFICDLKSHAEKLVREAAALGRAEAMARIEELETELGELRFIFNNQELALKISRQQVEKARAEGLAAAMKEIGGRFRRQARVVDVIEVLRNLKEER